MFHEEVDDWRNWASPQSLSFSGAPRASYSGNRYAKDIFTRGPDFHRDRRRADYQFGRVSILFSPLLFSPIAFWSPV